MKEKERFIILRSLPKKPVLPQNYSLGSFRTFVEAPEDSEIKIEVEELSQENIAKTMQHNDVIAVAPSIPMGLIKPVNSLTMASTMTATATWGIEALEANTSPCTGNGVVVGVLDTGIDEKHTAFSGVQLTIKDFTGEGSGDQNGHGTHCAGTIFGQKINGLRIGVATGIKKAIIGKVIGKNGGSSEKIAEAMQWAVGQGAQIISMSLGIDFPGLVKHLESNGMPTELATSKALEGYRSNIFLFESLCNFILAKRQSSPGTIIIAAAGNESRRDLHPDYKISVSPPAVSKGIISVGALAQKSSMYEIAPFSNTGVMISAPGVDIISAEAGGNLRKMSGTSMATPHAAGVAALWAEQLMKQGMLSSYQLTAKLLASGTAKSISSGFDPADIGGGLIKAPQ